MLTVNFNNILPFTDPVLMNAMTPRVMAAHDSLLSGTGEGAEFSGWLRLPADYDRDEFSRVKKASRKIRSDSEVLLVCGIGGSYLGARAVIEFIKSGNYNLRKKDTPDIYFIGNNLSPSYLNEVSEFIGGRDFSINVISKSGTTTEPAVAFRIFKKLIEDRYGADGARDRIYATTDKSRGSLKKLADESGYESFVIPDDIGGRYSVLTPVGLLPVACAGVDIDALVEGASGSMSRFFERDPENPVLKYALARNLLYEGGRHTEILACYEPSFRFMAEWWKQLYGESEGKDGKGIFPASVEFTADLHSMGQYIQAGRRMIFETVVSVRDSGDDFTIEADRDDIDGLNFLAGRKLSHVNRQAMLGTLLAHVDGGVPNIILEIDKMDEESLGELIYFFELSCGVSGYTLGVNPFNQPGVEAYKKNMFALLGKPGYESDGEKLRARLRSL